MHWQADSPPLRHLGSPLSCIPVVKLDLIFSLISLSHVNSETSQKTLEGRGKFLPYHHLPLHMATDMITAVVSIFLDSSGHRMALSGVGVLCTCSC